MGGPASLFISNAYKGNPDVSTSIALAQEILHDGFLSAAEPVWVKPLDRFAILMVLRV